MENVSQYKTACNVTKSKQHQNGQIEIKKKRSTLKLMDIILCCDLLHLEGIAEVEKGHRHCFKNKHIALCYFVLKLTQKVNLKMILVTGTAVYPCP